MGVIYLRITNTVATSLLLVVIPYRLESLFYSRRPNNYAYLHEWLNLNGMIHRHHRSTMTSEDVQSHIRDHLVTNNQYVGVLSTEWSYTNQLLFRLHFLSWIKHDTELTCPEWRSLLSAQYMAKQLSCRSLYISNNA